MKKIMLFKIISFLFFPAICFAMQNKLQYVEVKVASFYSKETRKKKPQEALKVISKQSKKPQIIVFAISKEGKLSERSLTFYVKEVLKPLNKYFNKNYQCFFYDLSSWDYSLWDCKENFDRKYCYSKKLINSTNKAGFSLDIIYSNDFFKWLYKSAKNFNTEFSNILKQELLWEVSCKKRFVDKSFPKLKETPLGQIGCFFPYLNKSVAIFYSTLQYIESIYLVEETVKKFLKKNKYKQEKNICEIILFLPNDEMNYYLGTKSGQWSEAVKLFQNNITPIVTKNVMDFLKESNVKSNTTTIDIKLLPFKYQENKSDNGYMCTRPYVFRKKNSISKGIKKDVSVSPTNFTKIITQKVEL